MIEQLKKEDIKLDDWEYQYQQRGEQPISLCDFFCRSLPRYLLPTLTGKEEACSYLFTDSCKGYVHRAEKEYIASILKEKTEDPAALHEILRNSIEIPRKFNAIADFVTQKMKEGPVSNVELAYLWQDMDDGFTRVIPWFFYPWYISERNFLTDRVGQGLERHRPQIEAVCDFDEAFLILVFPTKKTAFQMEQKDMLALVEIAMRNPEFPQDIEFVKRAKLYLDTYGWLTTFILTPLLPMTYDQLVERVRKAVAESFKVTFTIQQQSGHKNADMAKRLLSIFPTDTELIRSIEDACELGYVLTAGIEEAYRSSARYLDFMQVVAKQIGVNFEDLKYLLSDEVVVALTKNQSISTDLIRERKKGFVVMTRNGRQFALFGDEGHALSRWIDEQLNIVDTNLRLLHGTIASKGLAQGRVRRALTPDEAHRLVEGEILVTPMTNPDYVPAMRRAAAIVTDEGGLLCHAAIMSREFGKPCIIGTKIATQVLKNGDLVEVDATVGTVRIIESGKGL